MAMVRRVPSDRRELLDCWGWGESKVSSFGDRLLDALKPHAAGLLAAKDARRDAKIAIKVDEDVEMEEVPLPLRKTLLQLPTVAPTEGSPLPAALPRHGASPGATAPGSAPGISLSHAQLCCPWALNDDMALKEAIRTHGTRWATIAARVAELTGIERTVAMCRSRYQRIQAAALKAEKNAEGLSPGGSRAPLTQRGAGAQHGADGQEVGGRGVVVGPTASEVAAAVRATAVPAIAMEAPKAEEGDEVRGSVDNGGGGGGRASGDMGGGGGGGGGVHEKKIESQVGAADRAHGASPDKAIALDDDDDTDEDETNDEDDKFGMEAEESVTAVTGSAAAQRAPSVGSGGDNGGGAFAWPGLASPGLATPDAVLQKVLEMARAHPSRRLVISSPNGDFTLDPIHYVRFAWFAYYAAGA
jgi:hypothetical protein